MEAVLQRFAASSDIGHIALLLWALSATALLVRTLRELSGSIRRFDDFVRELARFNRRHGA